LAYLAKLSQLERLYLVDTQVTDNGLVHLLNLTKLRDLRLSGTQTTERQQLRRGIPGLRIHQA